MTNESQKVEAFLQSMNKTAETMCQKIIEDTDSFIEAELVKARDLAHENVRVFKKNETDRLNEANNSGFSVSEAMETKKLIEHRNEIANEVFSEITKKIEKFTESDEYLAFILRSIEKIKDAIGNNTVIFLRQADKKFEPELLKHCVGIKYDDSIILGGCKGENTSEKLTADDTLDIRLLEQKEVFYRTSKLSVTL